MIKLRVEGLPEEVGPFCDAFERTGAVLERSREYPNRGSRRVRVYMDVEVLDGAADDGGEGEIAARRERLP